MKLLKIGAEYMNLDNVIRYSDSGGGMVVHFSGDSAGENTLTFNEEQADELRTWLNIHAENTAAATDTAEHPYGPFGD